MPKEQSPGKPTTPRDSAEEKAAAVRMVRTLRTELGSEHGTIQRVAGQLGYGVAWKLRINLAFGATPVGEIRRDVIARVGSDAAIFDGDIQDGPHESQRGLLRPRTDGEVLHPHKGVWRSGRRCADPGVHGPALV